MEFDRHLDEMVLTFASNAGPRGGRSMEVTRQVRKLMVEPHGIRVKRMTERKRSSRSLADWVRRIHAVAAGCEQCHQVANDESTQCAMTICGRTIGFESPRIESESIDLMQSNARSSRAAGRGGLRARRHHHAALGPMVFRQLAELALDLAPKALPSSPHVSRASPSPVDLLRTLAGRLTLRGLLVPPWRVKAEPRSDSSERVTFFAPIASAW